MESYEILIFIICLASVFAYLNQRFIKWPPTIGIMALSLITSIIILLVSHFCPAQAAPLITLVGKIDFHDLLMNGMLGLLLFAGSIHIDAGGLRKERLPIITLATVGVLISTALVGYMFFYIFGAFGLAVSFIGCLLFAALISPTDPIAVLAILKEAGIQKSLELKIAGESLFNDGVAVVVFLTILEVAQTGLAQMTMPDILILFLREAVGGILYGLALGYSGYFAIKSINKPEVEIMITIAIVMGGYLLADKLHISGPLAMVVAGILIGNKRTAGQSKEHLFHFWDLVDNVLNALLFMLVGFELLVIHFSPAILFVGVIAIVAVLAARWVSVALPVGSLRYFVRFERNAVAILTWGGIRGGLSLALALSLPVSLHRDTILPVTYIVVVFSILVQGLTIGKLYRRLSSAR